MKSLLWNETVEAVYAAASVPGGWPYALQRIADLLDARGGLLLHRHDDGRIGTIVSPELVELNEEYNRTWFKLDVRAEYGFRAFANGSRDVQADHTFFTDEEVARLPIFQEFLHPRGFGWGMGAYVSPTPDVAVILSLVRAKDKPGFDDAEQEQLLAISRHVERALGLSIRLMDAEAERVGFSDALDRVGCGIVILAPNRRALLTNKVADQLLGTGLVISAGRLRAVDTAIQDALEMRFEVLERAKTPCAGAQTSLVVPNGDHGLILQILPVLAPIGVRALQTASAIALIADAGGNRPFDPAVVRDAFKLTLGEARLAALIGAGTAPKEAALALGITENTVRTVIKRIFEKVGISRQSELAALMGKLFLLRS
jgi:DNA-binding CsgD family transcriptional regulator